MNELIESFCKGISQDTTESLLLEIRNELALIRRLLEREAKRC